MNKTVLATIVAMFAVIGMALAAPASAAPKSEPGVGPLHAPCGTAGSTAKHTDHADAPLSGAVNQRNGTRAVSSTDCVIVGVLQPTDDARYFCWTRGNDGFTWTYLENLRTHVRGWSRDNLLDGNGSNDSCGL